MVKRAVLSGAKKVAKNKGAEWRQEKKKKPAYASKMKSIQNRKKTNRKKTVTLSNE